jgi:hypothetical protein
MVEQTKFYEPEENNIMKAMLVKGDKLRPRYENFDFEKLDSTQKRWLNFLTFFARQRSRIERIYEPEKITIDLKVIFLE